MSSWESGVEDVVNGKQSTFMGEEITVAPAKVIKLLESLGFNQTKPGSGGGIETNGWDYDWWLRFKKGKQKFVASGSGFYGGFAFEPDIE